MIPFTIVIGAEHIEPSLWLRDELRVRGVSCVVLAEPGHSATDVAASACITLAAAGISTLVVTNPAHLSSFLAGLRSDLPRVLAAQPSVDATVNDLQAAGWIPAQGEVYTRDELEAVTARLQELGYA